MANITDANADYLLDANGDYLLDANGAPVSGGESSGGDDFGLGIGIAI